MSDSNGLTRIAGMSQVEIRCLLVDDQPELLAIVKMILECEGISVTEAHDGVEALKILENSEHRFDVVITDILMPKMSGVQLLQAIKASDQLKEIPVVLLSGYSEHTLREVQEMGAHDLLEKPIHCDKLVAMIKSLAMLPQ